MPQLKSLTTHFSHNSFSSPTSQVLKERAKSLYQKYCGDGASGDGGVGGVGGGGDLEREAARQVRAAPVFLPLFNQLITSSQVR